MNNNLTLAKNLNLQMVPASETHRYIPERGINRERGHSFVRHYAQTPCPTGTPKPVASDSLNALFVKGGRVLKHHANSLRPDWDAYFHGIAVAVSARADCSRRKVGAVIVKDHRIVSTGYNGAASGGPSCLAGQCPRGLSDVAPLSSYDTGAGSCVAIHAEANALMYADREDRQSATLYITCAPCDGCLRLITGSGVTRLVYAGEPESLHHGSGLEPLPLVEILLA